MTFSICAEHISRTFAGRKAVDDVSFRIPPGEIFGFLGPNGAGKSTTARMLTGFIAPTAGTIHLSNIDVARHPAAARRHIGVVPEEASVYADLSVWENVMLMADLHTVAPALRAPRISRLLERFDIAGRRDQKGMELSKGLRQRLMLCMALVSEPEILFLDEPTSGLDVASTHLIRDIVEQENRARGMTVFLTTHNMDEAERLCHRVGIIDKGHLAAIDTPAALRDRIAARRSIEVRFAQSEAMLDALVASLPGTEVELTARGLKAYSADPGELAQHIVQRASALGLRIEFIATQAPTLEDVYLSITRKQTAAKH